MISDIDVEQRIRRAEEIYARRRGNDYYQNRTTTVKQKEIEKKKKSKLLKILIQLLCSLGIYLIISTIQKNNIYIKEMINNITRIEIDIPFYLNYVKKGFINVNNQVLEMLRNNEIQKEENNESKNNEIINNEKLESNINENNIELAIGGGKEEIEEINNDQMAIDIEYIKKNFEIVKPIEGIKTSGFGKREPTEIISEEHMGIDIAKEEGSKIISAISGKVIFSGYSNSFGNYIKIQNNDVVTIYGHCKVLYKKEGEEVHIGDEIAEVGMTGNATGPHLHFEIRRDNRVIDPELIINF